LGVEQRGERGEKHGAQPPLRFLAFFVGQPLGQPANNHVFVYRPSPATILDLLNLSNGAASKYNLRRRKVTKENNAYKYSNL
jgi:hypothetical protein